MNETITVAHGDVGANTIISTIDFFLCTVGLEKDDRIELFKPIIMGCCNMTVFTIPIIVTLDQY